MKSLRTADAESPRAPDASRTTLRILVVDDDPDTVEMLASAVAELGHEPYPAVGGLQALHAFERGVFDVVLSDWDMPDLSGLELCRRVRAIPRPVYTYFVFLTGLGDEAHLVEGMRAGADDYLYKPVGLEHLEVRLAGAARVLRLQKQLAAQNRLLRRDSDKLRVAANVDALTNAGNRRALEEHLSRISSGARREATSLALIDVDHFKAYNDHLVHLEGDRALRQIADFLQGHIRRGDALYRFGGEEFVAILAGLKLVEARDAAERLRAAVERMGICHPLGPLTISVGVAEFRPGVATETWLREADAAVYRAKDLGRNRVEVAGSEAVTVGRPVV